jgi:ribosomal protein S20
MQISSVTSGGMSALQGNDRFAKIKQSFNNLDSALESGNLDDAKTALAEIQKNAPKQASDSSNPMSQKMEALSKAIDSGDVKAAQDAYADIKKTMSQRPSGRPSGPPPGGAPPSGGAGKTSGTEASSKSNKTYDKMDANKDGKVSAQEEMNYLQKHPKTEKTDSTAKIDSDRGLIDAMA